MSFQERFSSFATQLRSIGKNEPLTKFSFFLILLLDVFIFSMILAGIGENTATLSRPEEYASYDCTSIIANMDSNERREKIISSISYWDDSYYSYKSYSSNFWNAPWCIKINEDISFARNSSDVQQIIEDISNIREQIQGIKTEQNNIASQYDTMLLEKIADQKPSDSLTPTTASEAKGKINYLNENLITLENSLASKEQEFDNQWIIQSLYKDISEHGPTIQSAYDSLVFWYPVKRFMVEIAFILPLLVVSLWWSRRSNRNNNGLQSLISSHLIWIVWIFILIKAIEFVYDIIPHRLLEKLYELLLSWNIIGVLYYLFIIIGVALTMGIIYFIQKKIFSPERLQAKRANHGECYLCGEKLMNETTHCIRCGEKQGVSCTSCGKMTNITSKYCGQCGQKI